MAVVIGRIIAFLKLAAAGLAVLAVVCGCGHADWDGKWTGDRGYKAKPNEGVGVAATLSKVELKIASGRYELVDIGVPRSGQVSSDDGALLLWADLIANQKVHKMQADGRLRRIDSDTLEFTGPGPDTTPVRLRRAP